MKIKKIYVKNLKSIQSLELDLRCKSAIIFGGNNKGKTTALRYLPEVALGEAKKVDGEMIWELNDGSQITYKNGVLKYVSDLQSSNITKDLARKLFNQYLFDIDEFLSLTPKKRTELLLDLFDIKDKVNELNERYDYLASLRLEAFRKKNALEQLANDNVVEPIEFNEQALEKIKQDLNILIQNRVKQHNEQEAKIIAEISAKNKEIQEEYELKLKEYSEYQKTLELVKALSEKLKIIEFNLTLETLKQEFKQKYPTPINRPDEPKLIHYSINKFNPDEDEEIIKLKKKLQEYEEKRSAYLAYQNYLKILKDYETARNEWESLDEQCKKIDAEKKEILSKIKLPNGIEIKDGEIYHNGFPLDKSIISTSQLYIAAMKLASVKMGVVKCITFDASILDKESLKDIINYCNENDLQLLVENVDFEGGDIVYEIIEK